MTTTTTTTTVAVVSSLLRQPPLRLLGLALAAYLAAGYVRRKWLTRRMPPFIPWSEMSWTEIVAYPVLGHLPVLSNPERLDSILSKHGELSETPCYILL